LNGSHPAGKGVGLMEVEPEMMIADKEAIEAWIAGFEALLLISTPAEQEKINTWITGFKTLLEL